jgi:hypothetical protein
MKRNSIIGYFTFGTSFRFLQDAKVGNWIKKPRFIIDNINEVLDHFDSLNLEVTKNASSELVAFRDELNSITNPDSTLTKEQASKMSYLCTQLRKTLEAELLTYKAFISTPKRFEINKLLDDIGSLMSPGVFDSLSETTLYDLSEAGKCIVFERPTAAAFHLLRGTESELRTFYCSLILNKRIETLLWGEMTRDLRQRAKTKMHVALYNNLDNIRINYRNPTQHPEKIYDIDEVQDLMPLCFEVISRMAKILKPNLKKIDV